MAVIVCLAAPAQRPERSTPLHETFNGKVKSVKHLSYEASGDSLNPVKQNRREDNQSSHIRLYDSLGRLISIQYLSSSDLLLERITFTYNAGGQVLQETHYPLKGIKGRSFTRTYSKKGQLLTEISLNDSQKVVHRITNEWKDTLIMRYSRQDDSSRCLSKIEYQRNKKGILQSEIWYDSDCQTVMSKIEYGYNKKGLLAVTHTYTPDGKLIAYKRYFHDRQDRLIERRDYTADSMLLQRVTWRFDEKGRQCEEMWLDTFGVVKKKWIQTFDTENRVIMEYRKRNPGEESESWLYFTYDDLNNITSKKIVRTTTATAQTERIEYDFDKHNNWTRKISFRGTRPHRIEEREFVYY